MPPRPGVRSYDHFGAIKGPGVRPLGGIFLTRVTIALPVLFLPFFLGGARPWFWSMFAALFMIGTAVLLWMEPESPSLMREIPVKWQAAGVFILAFPVLQLIPLPPSALAVLAPHRLLWLQRAAEAAGSPQGWAAISYLPVMTLFSLFWWVFLVLFGILLRNALREGSPEWFFRLLFLVAASEALYGILQVLVPSLGVLWEAAGTGDARGTFVNRNHFAAFLGMIWPVLLGYALSPEEPPSRLSRQRSYDARERNAQARQKQLFFSFLVGMVLFALVFSESRGGILSALIALTAFTIIGRIRRPGMLAFVVVCWGVMIAYGSIVGFGNIIARFDVLEGGAVGRFKIWADSCRLIRDHFLTGTGLDTFAHAIRLYQSHLLDDQEIVHAHSDYLELAGELGVPIAAGLTVLAWGYWVLAARRAWKLDAGENLPDRRRSSGPSGTLSLSDVPGGSGSAIHRSPIPAGLRADGIRCEGGGDPRRRLIAVGALAGSLAFLCHSVVEFNWQIPANQLYFVVLIVLMSL